MIGVDTNVLIRFLTADVPNQHQSAAEFFRSRSSGDPAYISAVTAAETVWVLRRSYGFSSDEIAGCIEGLLVSEDIHLEGREALTSLSDQAFHPARIADFLVAYLGAKAGCSHTFTFDRRAAKSVPGMELLA